jgi:hypothetical protein
MDSRKNSAVMMAIVLRALGVTAFFGGAPIAVLHRD